MYLVLKPDTYAECQQNSTGKVCNTCQAVNSYGINYFGSEVFAVFLRFLKERVCELNCGAVATNDYLIVQNSTFGDLIGATYTQYQAYLTGAKLVATYNQSAWDQSSYFYNLLLGNFWNYFFIGSNASGSGSNSWGSGNSGWQTGYADFMGSSGSGSNPTFTAAQLVANFNNYMNPFKPTLIKYAFSNIYEAKFPFSNLGLINLNMKLMLELHYKVTSVITANRFMGGSIRPNMLEEDEIEEF